MDGSPKNKPDTGGVVPAVAYSYWMLLVSRFLAPPSSQNHELITYWQVHGSQFLFILIHSTCHWILRDLLLLPLTLQMLTQEHTIGQYATNQHLQNWFCTGFGLKMVSWWSSDVVLVVVGALVICALLFLVDVNIVQVYPIAVGCGDCSYPTNPHPSRWLCACEVSTARYFYV